MAKAVKLKNELYLDTRGIVHKGKILADILYPVGSVYMSVDATDPSEIYGGTWQRIRGRFLWATGSTPKTEGGSTTTNETVLSVNQMPKHSHTRGTMNITGAFDPRWVDSSGGGIMMYIQSMGAMYTSRPGDHGYWWAQADVSGSAGTSGQYHTRLEFDASRNWTGSTSEVGGGAGHSHTYMPPYFEVYMWYRTA